MSQTTLEATVLNDLKTKKERVKYLLERYPHARDNDFYLMWLYLKIFEGLPLPYLDWKIIEILDGSTESVRRVRQKIQNEDKLFLPSVEVQHKRRMKQEAIRKVIKGV